MQNRIKEIVDETQNSPDQSTHDLSSGKKQHSAQSLIKAGKDRSILSAVKNELEAMCNEVLGVREALRYEGSRKDTLLNQKMTKFDEFKLQVLDQLILWDEKTAELAGLAERYSGALEEQRKLFGKLKLVVQEKDQIITELNQ